MKSYKTDISVLLLFHARADHFSQVWAEVKKARPSRLFLYQDGPRENSNDMDGIMACRELVKDENIDWQCEVHRLYQDRNYGCDPSGFMSHRWAFSQTDKCIVLEDDVVPSQSFFPYCKELLDRYENDERITMIAGFMTEEESLHSAITPVERHPSYFFSRAFSIWGWASWARVVNNWDSEYTFVKDSAQFAILSAKAEQYHQRKGMLSLCQRHAAADKEYFETIFWAYMMLHDGLAIFPSVNLINNIGLEGGTHYSTQLSLIPRRLRQQFTMPRKELSFPLTHPTVIKETPEYQQLWYLRNAWNNPWRKVQYSLEELWLNLKAGNIKNIVNSIANRIKKTIG